MTVWAAGNGDHVDTQVIDLGADNPVPQIGGGACRCFGRVFTGIEILVEIMYDREYENQSVLAAASGRPLGVIGGRSGRQALDELLPDSLGVLLRRVQRGVRGVWKECKLMSMQVSETASSVNIGMTWT